MALGLPAKPRPHAAPVISCVQLMKRLRALLLLATLLTSAVGGLAVNVLPAPHCCGGSLCPMHRDPQSARDKRPPGNDSSPQTCMCGPHQKTFALLPRLSPEAILMAPPILFQPASTLEGPVFSTGTVRIRTISPPDQPPRL